MRGKIKYVLILALLGCETERRESPTKGFVTVVVSESVAPMIEQEQKQFQELYPAAHVSLVTASAREAITRLFNDTIKIIVASRPFNDEEKKFIEKAHLAVASYRIAVDGIAILVNDANPVTQLRTTELDSIYRGLVTDWKSVGGKGAPIEVCLPDLNSANVEVVRTKVLRGGKFSPPARIVKTSPEMLDFVAERPRAIGMVGINWVSDKKENVRIVSLMDPQAPDSLGIKGEYILPYQAYLYKGFYPLTRDVYIYSRSDNFSPAAGFLSFVTSAPGQKIVLNNGLVPATMPVRLVELTNKGTSQ